jgi:hypothetical protein
MLILNKISSLCTLLLKTLTLNMVICRIISINKMIMLIISNISSSKPNKIYSNRDKEANIRIDFIFLIMIVF